MSPLHSLDAYALDDLNSSLPPSTCSFSIEINFDELRLVGVIISPSLSSLPSILQPDLLPLGSRTFALQFSPSVSIGVNVFLVSNGAILQSVATDWVASHPDEYIVTLSYHQSRTLPHVVHHFAHFFSPTSLLSVARLTFELKGLRDKITGKHWSHAIEDVAPGVRLFVETDFMSSGFRWRTVSFTPSRSSIVAPRFSSGPSIASRFVGRYGPSGPKRILPSSLEDLPDFTSSFPDIFAACNEGRSSDEQVILLMIMMTQLSRFKLNKLDAPGPTAAAAAPAASSDAIDEKNHDSIKHYIGSSARHHALEEIVLCLSAAAAKQVKTFSCTSLANIIKIEKFCIYYHIPTRDDSTSQAMILLSECIRVKSTFKLINQALSTCVPTTVEPTLACDKIIAMKFRSGSLNVCPPFPLSTVLFSHVPFSLAHYSSPPGPLESFNC